MARAGEQVDPRFPPTPPPAEAGAGSEWRLITSRATGSAAAQSAHLFSS